MTDEPRYPKLTEEQQAATIRELKRLRQTPDKGAPGPENLPGTLQEIGKRMTQQGVEHLNKLADDLDYEVPY